MDYKKEFEEIRTDLKEIKDALKGNEYNPGGLVQEHLALKKKVNKLILYSSIVAGALIGFFFIIEKFKLLQ